MLGGNKLFAFVSIFIIVSSASATYHFLSGPEDVLESDEEPDVMEDEVDWHYKIPIEVHSGMFDMEDRVVSQVVNVTKEIGGMGNYDENSLRMHETNESWHPMWETVYQERWLDDERVKVSWLLNRTTPADSTRYFMLKFDTIENGPKPEEDSFDSLVDIEEDEDQIWVRGEDYEVKVDTQRGGSRVVKYDNGTRRGYVFDTTWMSWHSDNMNWRKKGAEVKVAAAGPLYVELDITSSCGTEGYTWYFYNDSMGIELKNESQRMSFDTIADNVINTDGSLVWSNGHSENLTMTNPGSGGKPPSENGPPDEVSPGPPGGDDSPPGRRYSTHRNFTDYFYIIGPEDKETNKSAGFWAVTEAGLVQTVHCAGEKGLRWEMNGTEARFGFADYADTRNVTLSHQFSSDIHRHRTIVHMTDPDIWNEVHLEEQRLLVEGDMRVYWTGSLNMLDMEVLFDGDMKVSMFGDAKFQGSVLHFREASLGEKSLSGNGEINLLNSRISTDEGHHLKVNLKSNSTVRGSTFRHLWNGVEVYSDDIEITDVDIKHSKGAGILVIEGVSPLIRGGKISGCKYGLKLGAAMINSTVNTPEADFSYEPEDPSEGEEVEFKDETEKTHKDMELYYSWSFDDGHTSKEQNPTHVFSAGVYEVTLTVWAEVDDDSVGKSSISKTIQVTSEDSPTAGFTVDSEASLPYHTFDELEFIDGSTPAENGPELVGWEWDFGDGSQVVEREESTVETHQYTSSGTYTVSLTVTDANGDTSTEEKEFDIRNTPPNANFSFDPEQQVVGEEVRFECESTDIDGEIEEWEWDFGDGTNGDDKYLSHSYDEERHYNVTLTVWDDEGASDNMTRTITVGEPPVARISEYKIVGNYTEEGEDDYRMEVRLDGSGSYSEKREIVDYRWEFVNPDGTEEVIEGENEEVVTYEYKHTEPAPGIYFPRLTVTDEDGWSHTTSTRVVSYDPDANTVSGLDLFGNTIGLLIMAEEYENEQIGRTVTTTDNYVNIFDSNIYDNDIGVSSEGIDFAIEDTHIFDNDDSVWLDAKDRDKITMIPVTGAYDRGPGKLEFYNFAYEWDPDEDLSGDGLSWTDELYRYGTDPELKSDITVDTDDDDLTNQDEADVYSTDPLGPDTDGDGLTDLQEIEFGTNPLHYEPSSVSYRVTTVYPDRFETELVNLQQEEVDRWKIQADEDPLYGPIDLSSVQQAGDILYPSIGNPLFVDRTDPSSRTFTIYVNAWESDYIGDEIKLELVDGSDVVNVNKVEDSWDETHWAREVTVEVSSAIPEGLYNMKVEKGQDNWIEASNSVQVVDGFSMPFKFVQITDLHIGKSFSVELEMSISISETFYYQGYSETYSKTLYESDDRSYNAARFMAILDRINQIEKPDFVLITGDSVDYNHEKSMKAFRGALEYAQVPVFAIPGNHERGGLWEEEISTTVDLGYLLPSAEVEAEMSFIPYETRPTYFYEYINPEFDSGDECPSRLGDLYFDYGDFRSIVADSGPLKVEWGYEITLVDIPYIGEVTVDLPFPDSQETKYRARVNGFIGKQWDWIRDTAEGQDHVFFFTHGRIVGGGEEQRGRLAYYTEDFVEWANRDDVNVHAVFNGHWHRTGGYEDRDLTNINEDDYTWDSEGTISFDEPTVYIETGSSTDA
ncbi:MAG: PKD domain-containing protein [Candidatus Saliniplasma sp.]